MQVGSIGTVTNFVSPLGSWSAGQHIRFRSNIKLEKTKELAVHSCEKCCGSGSVGSICLGLPDPDPLVRDTDPATDPATDPDPSIKQK